jgi:hypothetical protein
MKNSSTKESNIMATTTLTAITVRDVLTAASSRRILLRVGFDLDYISMSPGR